MKTLAQHRDYLHGIVRLKLWYLARYLRANPHDDFRTALRYRVDIYRKTDCNRLGLVPPDAALDFEGPWRELEDRLLALWRREPEDAERFEAEGFAVLRPAVDRRAPRDWIDVSRLNGFQCGSLRYDPQEPGCCRAELNLHIANALQPESMFDKPGYLCVCLAELMRQGEMKYGCTGLHCDSWLNALPKWLDYFPAEYRENLGPENRDVRWHYGFWGQFVTAGGLFHEKYAASFRHTGEMPCYPRYGRCSFAALKRHLQNRFGFDAEAPWNTL